MKLVLKTPNGKYEIVDCKFIEFKEDKIIISMLNDEKQQRNTSDIYYIVRHDFSKQN